MIHKNVVLMKTGDSLVVEINSVRLCTISSWFVVSKIFWISRISILKFTDNWDFRLYTVSFGSRLDLFHLTRRIRKTTPGKSTNSSWYNPYVYLLRRQKALSYRRKTWRNSCNCVGSHLGYKLGACSHTWPAKLWTTLTADSGKQKRKILTWSERERWIAPIKEARWGEICFINNFKCTRCT